MEKRIWMMVDEDLGRLFEAAKTKESMLKTYAKEHGISFEIRYTFGLGTYTMEVWKCGEE